MAYTLMLEYRRKRFDPDLEFNMQLHKSTRQFSYSAAKDSSAVGCAACPMKCGEAIITSLGHILGAVKPTRITPLSHGQERAKATVCTASTAHFCCLVDRLMQTLFLPLPIFGNGGTQTHGL
jgi:hypothetical protein